MAGLSFHEEGGAIAREGYPFVGVSFFLAVGGFFAGWIVFVALVLLCCFFVFFFRNPRRSSPDDPKLVVSPADGRVVQIVELEEGCFLEKKVRRVSIFMSPLDVHVNRMPVTGTIREVCYNRGKFLAAFSEKAPLENEQNAILMTAAHGGEILFVQVAGWLARRIVCRAKVGEHWRQGENFGMICFGSRVDVYVPLDYEVTVKIGDKVKAGENVLAVMRQ